ncbi:uncharacterized protein [Asterias amurensis]|uniref:uncharacterized protein n=1 Tax=Asterias amurensis TaxID=7602 RepID=UPI003AB1D893
MDEFGVISLFCMFLLMQNAKGFDCSIGHERDPNEGNRYRWVIPVDDPCKCTRLRVGGLNTRTPCRHFNVTYYDNFMQSDNAEEIRKWLNCTDVLEKHLILNRSLRQDGNPEQCNIPTVSSTEYDVRGNPDLLKMVPGPDVAAGHACAVYTQVGSYLDIGDFNKTCISDPGLCKSMTWSLWLKIDTSSGFTGNRYYISSGGQTSQARGIALLYKSKGSLFYYMVGTVSSTSVNKYHKTQIPLNSWFHLALTIEMNQGVVNMLKLYVDGEFKEEAKTSKFSDGNVDGCTRLYLGMTNTCDKVYQSDTYSGSAAYSNLMVFDRLLNQEEIKNLKN